MHKIEEKIADEVGKTASNVISKDSLNEKKSPKNTQSYGTQRYGSDSEKYKEGIDPGLGIVPIIKAPQKTATIDKNFLGVYDNYITKEECDKAIKLFEQESKFSHTFNRIKFENSDVTFKQDDQYFMKGGNMEVWWEECKTIFYNFDMAFRHYTKNTGAGAVYNNIDFNYTTIKIQKTLPTEGYHAWHIEHSSGLKNMARAFTLVIYLNDVKEGGETEFLHYSTRVQPKAGRIVIFPAAFPYLHRGNPPLKGEKYIITSWMLLSKSTIHTY